MQRVGTLVEVPRLLREAGVDPDPVLRAAGLHPGQLSDPDIIIRFEQFAELVLLCAEATGEDTFDLVIGAAGRTRHLGVLGTFMACGPSLGSAIDDLVSNQPGYVRGGGPYLLDLGNGDILIGYRTHLPGLRGASRIARGAVAFGFSVFRELAGVAPKGVQISLPPPKDPQDYAVAFDRVPVRFNAEHFGLVYSRASLRAPTLHGDPELRRQLAETIAARWAVHQPDIRERVMRALVPSVFSGTHSLEATAMRMNMAPDALARELKAKGCSFRDLLNEARLEMASQLLTDARMSIAEVAFLLGYSEMSAFTRFFTSARGVAPAEFRRLSGARASSPAEVAAPGPAASATPPA